MKEKTRGIKPPAADESLSAQLTIQYLARRLRVKKIGFFAANYAKNLTAEYILDALHNAPSKLIKVSKQKHWCWNSKNPEHIDEPK